MEKRQKILVTAGIAVLVAAAVLGAVFAFRGAGSKAGRTRENTLSLARDYMQKGAYDRALDLLDKLLIENAGDTEAAALRDETVAAQSACTRRGAAGSRSDSGMQPISSPVTVCFT